MLKKFLKLIVPKAVDKKVHHSLKCYKSNKKLNIPYQFL